jgi:hypothetical protein
VLSFSFSPYPVSSRCAPAVRRGRDQGGFQARTKTPWVCDVAYERFLAPEIFFSPEIYSSDFRSGFRACGFVSCCVGARWGVS